MSRGDVKVVGVRTGMVLIDDIGVSVPNGVVVSIPAQQALRSKDLYRLISQRMLFQIHPGPIHKAAALPEMPPPPPPTPNQTVAPTDPSAREALLEAELKVLREALDQREHVLFAALVAAQGRSEAVEQKLDQVLATLSRQPAVPLAAPNPFPVQTGRAVPIVASDAPLFIPSEIKPRDVEAHVSIESETTDSNVSGATSALRRLRGQG